MTDFHVWKCEPERNVTVCVKCGGERHGDKRDEVCAAGRVVRHMAVHPSSLTDVVTTLEAERDAAVAEVERLRAIVREIRAVVREELARKAGDP